jgi:hypothetical protein
MTNKNNNLIGISGKIGSGKDTVGKIIQYLTDVRIRSSLGLEEFLSPRNVITSEYSRYEIKKFSGKLKDICALLIGCSVDDFESQDFKLKELPECWNKTSFVEVNGISKHVEKMTVRKLLQTVGTEAMRDNLHNNVWVNALFADYDENDSWVITDMRFPNEMKAVEDRGGITIRVERTIIHKMMESNIKVEVEEHSSERALDGAKFDYLISNNDTIIELAEKIRNILIEEKIIMW